MKECKTNWKDKIKSDSYITFQQMIGVYIANNIRFNEEKLYEVMKANLEKKTLNRFIKKLYPIYRENLKQLGFFRSGNIPPEYYCFNEELHFKIIQQRGVQ